jgi:hypothetical protein
MLKLSKLSSIMSEVYNEPLSQIFFDCNRRVMIELISHPCFGDRSFLDDGYVSRFDD